MITMRNYSEGHLAAAVRAVTIEKMSYRKAEKVYGVPRSTISEHVRRLQHPDAPMPATEAWIVGEVVRHTTVVGNGIQLQLRLSWHDGMIGMCPVFDTYETARAYADEQEALDGNERQVWSVNRAPITPEETTPGHSVRYPTSRTQETTFPG